MRVDAGRRLRGAVADLNPGCFALVMATGILSVAMNNQGLTVLSLVLLWLALAALVVLLGATLWRVVAFRTRLRADLVDPARSFGFFTVIAAVDVVGARIAAAGHRTTAVVLLLVGSALWLVLGYLVPWLATVGERRHSPIESANGTWFVWVVATQSVAVLAATLQPRLSTGADAMGLLAVFSWSTGVFLYASAGTFVAVRMLLYPLRAADLGPPYWVAMGATAITVLGGARIGEATVRPEIRSFAVGASVAFWCFGTWLIPALLAAGWWRHVVQRVPLRYEIPLWSIVFPIGMYGVASHELGTVASIPIVRRIGDAEAWVALAVWTLTAAAMVHAWTRTVSRPSEEPLSRP
jgi:tellurite resistance protein TehA-like permease